jgi:hypothetical protein
MISSYNVVYSLLLALAYTFIFVLVDEASDIRNLNRILH